MVPQPVDIVVTLVQHHDELRERGVASLVLFGSVARRQATETSDIDLLVDFDRPVGLFAPARLQAVLQVWLGRRVDLVPRDSLRPELRERVLTEGLRAA
ncbi:MAG TPA: nucleotidyltransferase family protein [Polyangiaceae bacterium]|nr:nucleotidyltransferase family protein [Polyangiaceae bacterium]